jgi:hypothetical protein
MANQPRGATVTNTNGRARSAVKHRWVYGATTMQLAAVATMVGVVVWVLMAGMDLLATMYDNAVTVPMATLNSLVGLACGALLFKLMLAERTRQRQVVERLRMIAEINHHIRNALDRIELTAHVTHDRQLIDDIEGGVQRIQWALRELLPDKEADEASQSAPFLDV